MSQESRLHDKVEAQLVKLAQARDHQAFVKLLSGYKKQIAGMASRYGRNEEEARDLVQDISLALWKSLPRFRGDAPFEHWLLRVSSNCCMRFLRKHYRRKKLGIVDVSVDDMAEGTHTQEGVDVPVSQERSAAEARDVLMVALRQLPPRDVMLLTLREIEGRSMKEIAEIIDCSENTVKVRVHRARNHLRTVLESLGET